MEDKYIRMDEKEFVKKIYAMVFPYSPRLELTSESLVFKCQEVKRELRNNLCKREMKHVVVLIAKALDMDIKENDSVSNICSELIYRLEKICPRTNVSNPGPRCDVYPDFKKYPGYNVGCSPERIYDDETGCCVPK